MGQGQGSILNQQKRENPLAPGPPFVPTSAFNGLSVDPVTGQIVLGNDSFGVQDAILINTREIPLNGNGVRFPDYGQDVDFQIFGGNIGLSSFTFGNTINWSVGSPGQVLLNMNADPTDPTFVGPIQEFQINGVSAQSFRLFNNAGEFEIADFNPLPGQNRFLSLDQVNSVYQFGDIDTSGNGTIFGIDDSNQIATIDNNGLSFLSMDFATQLFEFGATPSTDSLRIDAANSLAEIFLATNRVFNFDNGNGQYSMGDIDGASGNSVLLINDAALTITATAFNGFGVNMSASAQSPFAVFALPAFANNAAATGAGLVPGEFYRISVAGTSAVAVVE